MKRVGLKLRSKVTLINIIVVFVSVIITTIFVTQLRISNIKKETETNIMNTAEIVAHSQIVINSLVNKTPGENIQKYVNEILDNTKKIDVLVVADMNGIRYAHPNDNKVGLKIVGGDEEKVLKTGERYISDAVGTLGRQTRAFAPVINDKGIQVGFVVASNLTKSIEREKHEAIITLAFISLVAFLIGSISSIILSRNIKSTLLGLEPEQLTKLYIQKREVLDAMNEGIIAIDKNLNIMHFNNKAIKMLDIKNKSIMNNNIYKVIPNSRLPIIMQKGQNEYNREMVINDAIIVSNRITIKEGKKIIGAVAIFRDKTEVTRLAEEITGVKQVVEALRANTHEFMNKLHVILGLIQIEELEEAKKYILKQTKEQQQKVSLVMKKIEEPAIAALMLGKISRGKEQGIDLYLDKDSYLKKMNGRISSNAFITIIGNLLENAIESVNSSDKNEKLINILIKEVEDKIIIIIEDTGGGIKGENLSKIFIKGFSTKDGNRGRGLSLVKEVVEDLNGQVQVLSQVDVGTKFEIIIPKEKKND